MSGIEPGRKEITLGELDKRVQKHGPNVGMANVQVEGICTIFDKDGNIKSTMDITSIEVADECEAAKRELENGTS